MLNVFGVLSPSMDITLLICILVFGGVVWGAISLAGRVRPGFSQGQVLDQELIIDGFRFPSSLAYKLQETYPHLSSSQVNSVLTGLRDFFQICREAAPALVAMPSQVVDVAWHEFILSTRAYHEFCE